MLSIAVRLVGGLAICVALGACGIGTVARAAPSVADANRIETTFEVLESLQVERVELRDGCQSLIYRRGAYSKAGSNDECYVFPERMALFDQQASTDFADVQKAITDTHVGIFLARLQIDRAGHLSSGSFDIGCDSPCEQAQFIFDSEGTIDDDMHDIPAEDWGQLNHHWWWYKEH